MVISHPAFLDEKHLKYILRNDRRGKHQHWKLLQLRDPREISLEFTYQWASL